MRIVIIGGSFAGIYAAISLRKSCPDSEIILLEKQDKIGFIPSGLNLLLKKQLTSKEQLYWLTKEELQALYAIDVQVRTEVVSLEIATKTVFIQNGRQLTFDTLVIATGSSQQFKNGNKSTQIRSVKDIHLKESLEQSLAKAQKIAVIGAGQVGLELAEGLYHQQKEIHLYESRPTLLFRYFDPEMVEPLTHELLQRHIQLFLNEQVQTLEENEQVAVVTDQKTESYDLVLLANHTRPDHHLWQDQLKLNEDGTIWVDEYLQTSAKDIYAIGDAIQVTFQPTQEKMYVSLVNNALRTAQVVSQTISGKRTKDPGTYRAIGNHWFGYFLGGVGLTEEESIFYPQTVRKTYLLARLAATNSETAKIKVMCNEKGQLLGAQLRSREEIFDLLDRFTLAIEEGWTLEKLFERELFFQPEYRLPLQLIKVVDTLDED
ncbi:FAD-dependent oxidoreductase [Enterococcus hirae]|uniref:FAD-dependent oxidoreductase n=1 Tax=Enterococcus hirae TaxID=1354 RepID=UPI0032E401AF